MPLFGDHYDTMTRVAAKGMGIMLHWKYMSEEDLHTALTSIITDSRSDFYVLYQQSTQLNVIVYQCHLVAALWCTSLCPLAYSTLKTALVPTPLSLRTKVSPASTTSVQHSQRPARPPCDQSCLLDQLHPPSQWCQPPALCCV